MDIRAQDDIAAAAAIPAIGPAARHEFLAPEAYATPPAVTGLREDFDSINKHRTARVSGRLSCHATLSLSSGANKGQSLKRLEGLGATGPQRCCATCPITPPAKIVSRSANTLSGPK